MFDFKTKWIEVFDSKNELETLFAGKETAVSPSGYGQVLWVRYDDELYAFENKCPHQNKPLNDCKIEEGYVVCPFHQYHFAIENGRGHGTAMLKYEVKEEDGKIFIGKEVFSIF